MTPVARRERDDMSLTSNPRFGPQEPTAVLKVFEIMVEVLFSHLPTGGTTQNSEMEGGSPWSLRCSTRRSRTGCLWEQQWVP